MTSKWNYYFGLLTQSQRALYTALYQGMKSFAKTIELPYSTTSEISQIFSYVLLETPMFFYVDSFTLSGKYGSQQRVLRPKYKFSRNEVKKYICIIEDFLQIFDSVESYTDLNKEQYIHDFCMEHVKYDNSF